MIQAPKGTFDVLPDEAARREQLEGQVKRVLEAAEAWSRLCAIRAGDWRAWSNLANALGEIGRWRESVPALERAVALNPGNLV